MSGKPKCYNCIYRGEVPGSCHSICHHPTAVAQNPMNEMMAIFASVGRAPPVIGSGAQELNIKGNMHGITSGWFNWPFNFDPVWLENCDGFTPKAEPKNASQRGDAA